MRFLQRTKSQNQNHSTKVSVPARGALTGVGFDAVRPDFEIWSIRCDDNYWSNSCHGMPHWAQQVPKAFPVFPVLFSRAPGNEAVCQSSSIFSKKPVPAPLRAEVS